MENYEWIKEIDREEVHDNFKAEWLWQKRLCAELSSMLQISGTFRDYLFLEP